MSLSYTPSRYARRLPKSLARQALERFSSASAAHLVLFSWRLCEAAELHGAVQQTGIQDADGLRMTAARKMEMSRVRWQASQSHDRRVPWRLARLQAASTIVCSLHIKAILSAKLQQSSSDGQWSNHKLQVLGIPKLLRLPLVELHHARTTTLAPNVRERRNGGAALKVDYCVRHFGGVFARVCKNAISSEKRPKFSSRGSAPHPAGAPAPDPGWGSAPDPARAAALDPQKTRFLLDPPPDLRTTR